MAGGLLSSGGGGSTTAAVPRDLANTRGTQIQLLNYLLGFGPGGAGGGQRGQPGGQAGGAPMSVGGSAGQIAINQKNGQGGRAGFTPPAFDDIRSRFEGLFGPLGVPTTGLQRQSTDAIAKMNAMPAPEQRTLDIALPALQSILNGQPGQGVIDALRPSFDRNLASANQTGARFGSANAVLRSRAVDDFNLLGAQAAQQGQQTQLAAADALRLLGESAGQNPFARQVAGYGVGAQQAAQDDIATQRFLQILLQQLGTAQSATLGVPVQQNPGGFQNFVGGAGSTAALLGQLMELFGGGGGSGKVKRSIG